MAYVFVQLQILKKCIQIYRYIFTYMHTYSWHGDGYFLFLSFNWCQWKGTPFHQEGLTSCAVSRTVDWRAIGYNMHLHLSYAAHVPLPCQSNVWLEEDTCYGTYCQVVGPVHAPSSSPPTFLSPCLQMGGLPEPMRSVVVQIYTVSSPG